MEEGWSGVRLKHGDFLLFLFVFALVAAGLSFVIAFTRAVLVGFDAAALVFLLLTLELARKRAADQLPFTSAGSDAGRWLLLLLSALLLAIILVAVGVEIVHRRGLQPTEVLLVVLTLALGWLFGNLVAARHYAHLFYAGSDEAAPSERLIFPSTSEPDLGDFIYFALVLGMTFQVSDVQIASRRIRRAATMHAVMAFFFNMGVLALTVNVIASAN